MRERVTVVLFLSVCENNIWELMPLQPLKYAQNGRRPYFIGFKCAGFFDKPCCLGDKASQNLAH